MGMPAWWGERRYGIFFDVSLACVPAWAPIGAPANRYRDHLGEEPPDGGSARPFGGPLVEVLAHHRDRWGHIDRYDDFAPLLTFDRFDAADWSALAGAAGAGYAVVAAKHHDGWCWWDAPATGRTLLHDGPRRDVLADVAGACRRDDIVLGAFYSLEHGDRDAPDGAPDGPVVGPATGPVIGAQVGDLVERYGLQLLLSDTARPPLDAAELDASLTDRLAEHDGGLVVDDSLAALLSDGPGGPTWSDDRCIATICGDPPAGVVERPWQLCRPLGRGMGHNRTETEAHQMTAAGIVALLTEVVAKGGNLLLAVGPAADGTIPDLHRRPLLDAAPWIVRHRDLLAHAHPWSSWGDDDTRYWLVGDVLHAVDLSGRGRFAALGNAGHTVESVTRLATDPAAPTATTAVAFEQDADGLRLAGQRHNPVERGPRSVDPPVYRIELRRREAAVELFEPVPPSPLPLAPLLEGARAGQIVQLGDGVHLGPAVVPEGVTVRGLGPDRTTIDAGGGPLALGLGSRLEHLAVRAVDGEGRRADTAGDAASVRVTGDAATILGCEIDALLVGADDVTVRATALRRLSAVDADRLLVSRSRFSGDRSATAITIEGGSDHTIDSCEFNGHLCAIRAIEATGIAIAGNHIEARWWGVRLERTDHAHVHRNLMIATMRAVDVDGGAHAVIDGNAVFDGDSGCLVQRGAAGCEISGNHWERCRIGILGWEVDDVREVDNHAVDLHEPENRFVVGP
jgi:alpha-L-fucosidase